MNSYIEKYANANMEPEWEVIHILVDCPRGFTKHSWHPIYQACKKHGWTIPMKWRDRRYFLLGYILVDSFTSEDVDAVHELIKKANQCGVAYDKMIYLYLKKYKNINDIVRPAIPLTSTDIITRGTDEDIIAACPNILYELFKYEQVTKRILPKIINVHLVDILCTMRDPHLLAYGKYVRDYMQTLSSEERYDILRQVKHHPEIVAYML